MLKNDFIAIIDHVSVSQASFNEERYVKMVTKIIRHSLINTKLLTVPENLLFITDHSNFKQHKLHRPQNDLYSGSMLCPHNFRCLQKISVKTTELIISPTKTSWALPVKRLDGSPVFAVLSGQANVQEIQWKEIRGATLRDILAHRGISMHRLLAAQAKEISEMATKLNFTPVDTSQDDYYKKHYDSVIPAVMMDRGLNRRTAGKEFSTRSSLFQTFLYCTDKKPVGTDLLAFFNPFGLKMWLCFAMSFTGLCSFVILSDRASPGYAVILILTPLVSQSVTKEGMKGKELMLLWNFTAFLLSTLYVCFIGSLLVVPRKHERLKTFEDLVKTDYHIQIRGKTSSTYLLLTNVQDTSSLVHNNKYLKSLAKSADLVPQDHHQYLERLANTRKTVAMNTVGKVENYLRYLQKHYARSECAKGEERICLWLILVISSFHPTVSS